MTVQEKKGGMQGRPVLGDGDHRSQRVVSYIGKADGASWGMAGLEMALEIGGAVAVTGRTVALARLSRGWHMAEAKSLM